MTSPQQAASAAFEERMARYLRESGETGAERLRVKHPDRGDIGHVPGWTIEIKGIAPGNGSRCGECGQARGRFDMAAAVDQMLAAQKVNEDPFALLIRQRKRAPDRRQYAIMELGQAVRAIPWLRHYADSDGQAV